jgi:hypothetical protein
MIVEVEKTKTMLLVAASRYPRPILIFGDD